MNITVPLRRLAAMKGDSPALIAADGRVMSYSGLDTSIDRMATRAMALGLRPGDVATLEISGPDETLGIVMALALARLGVASAGSTFPRAKVRQAFGTEDGAAIEPSWLEADREDRPVPIHEDASAILRIFASSGTTGLPKQIAVSHALMNRRMFAYALALDPRAETRIVAVSFGITWGFVALLRTLWAGGTVVLGNPASTYDAITRHNVTSIAASPVSLRAILEAMPRDAAPPPSLRTIEVSGSACPAPLRDAAASRLCPRIVSFMGSTETGGIACIPIAPARKDTPSGDAGFVLAGVTAEAVDDAGQSLPAGVQGQIRIRSDGLASGYVGDPVATATSFRDGWFLTGDVGTVWPNGRLTLAGRTSDLINVGGVKVSPRPIEEALLAVPSVTDAVAFGVPDAYGVDQVWAAIVADVPIDSAVLNAACRDSLGRVRPRMIMQIKALPRNANGKVRRDVLVEFAAKQGR